MKQEKCWKQRKNLKKPLIERLRSHPQHEEGFEYIDVLFELLWKKSWSKA